jgi:hypothetical protein
MNLIIKSKAKEKENIYNKVIVFISYLILGLSVFCYLFKSPFLFFIIGTIGVLLLIYCFTSKYKLINKNRLIIILLSIASFIISLNAAERISNTVK